MNQKTKTILKSFFILALFAFSIRALAVWTNPTAAPAGGNAIPPINVGTISQQKDGIFASNGFRSFGSTRLDSYVGIGTDSNPAYMLDVSGNVRLGTAADEVFIPGGATLDNGLLIRTGELRTKPGINLGVGMDTSPVEALEVSGGNIKINTVGKGIIFADGTTQTTAATGGSGGTGGNQWLSGGGGIYSNGSGPVGISVASPGNRFYVGSGYAAGGTTAVNYALAVGKTDGTQQLTLGFDSTNTYLQSWNLKPLLINYQGNDVVFGPGSILASGSVGTTPASGAGTRIMWIPAKSAFRAGYVNGTQWDDASVGLYSTAIGYNTKASGVRSFASGTGSIANGIYSTAIGENNTASGNVSIAMGTGSIATGNGDVAIGGANISSGTYYSLALGGGTKATAEESTSMGSGTEANGITSTSMGYLTVADGDYSTATGAGTRTNYNSFSVGRWNIGGGSNTSWIATDPLFEIGNGDSATRANALTVYKNGRTTINGNTTINGDTTINGNTNVTGFLTTTINTQTIPDAGGGLAVGWNRSGGEGELNIYNTYISSNGGAKAFTFSKKVVASYTDLMTIDNSGFITQIGAKNCALLTNSLGKISCSSDANLKKNMTPFTKGISIIEGINPSFFQYKNETYTHVGFIAQNVQKVLPEATPIQGDGYLGLDTNAILAASINAIKEQQVMIKQQQKEIDLLKQEVELLKNK